MNSRLIYFRARQSLTSHWTVCHFLAANWGLSLYPSTYKETYILQWCSGCYTPKCHIAVILCFRMAPLSSPPLILTSALDFLTWPQNWGHSLYPSSSYCCDVQAACLYLSMSYYCDVISGMPPYLVLLRLKKAPARESLTSTLDFLSWRHNWGLSLCPSTYHIAVMFWLLYPSTRHIAVMLCFRKAHLSSPPWWRKAPDRLIRFFFSQKAWLL